MHHVRKYLIYYSSCLKNPRDITMLHDWPLSVLNHGNLSKLIGVKPHFKHEGKHNLLSNRKLNALVHVTMQPKHWLSSHLHVDYEAAILHNVYNNKVIYFRTLDKVDHNDNADDRKKIFEPIVYDRVVFNWFLVFVFPGSFLIIY